MIKRPFFALAKPKFRYSRPQKHIDTIPVSSGVTLLAEQSSKKSSTYAIKSGDKVKTGQKLNVFTDSDAYVISTVTGKITKIEPFIGDFGKVYASISIQSNPEDEWDCSFLPKDCAPDLNTAIKYFQCLPGNPCFKVFDGNKIETVIINGMDQDLLLTSNQFAAMTGAKTLQSGVDFLKSIAGVKQVILAVPERMLSSFNGLHAEIKTIDETYPCALPEFLIRDLLGKVLPAGSTPDSIGVTILTAESVAAIGDSISNGKLAIEKIITVIKKDCSTMNIKARIGTPASQILSVLNISLKEGDRLIFGGPLRGRAVYCDEMAIMPCTDGIMIQDATEVSTYSDYPCTNCGECVRICPANVAINDLVRYLENARYAEAAELYDLYSCVECGLCSVVCPNRMPIFQYIKLGKHELNKIKQAEAENASA